MGCCDSSNHTPSKAGNMGTETDNAKPLVIFVMGGPGVGKGTQCRKLLAQFPQLDSYSTGALLRKKVAEGTKESAELKQKMSNGELISSELVVGLMKEYMQNSEKNIFLADGFPRSQENIDVWEKVMGDVADLKFLLLFDLDGETMLERLLKRASESAVKRDDDTEEVFHKRIETFEKSLPIF